MKETLVEKLAVAVHQAWMEERIRQGTPDHACNLLPGTLCKCGRKAEDHHPDMIPYWMLSEKTKEYDRATVRAVLVAIRTMLAKELTESS